LKTGCEEIKHYQRKLKEKTCQQLKDALYGCSCGSVVKEKKACKTFDQCYAAAVTNKKSNEKEIKKKMLLPSSSGVQLVVLNASIKVMSGKKKADAKQLEKCQGTPNQYKTPGFEVSSHAAETEVCTCRIGR